MDETRDKLVWDELVKLYQKEYDIPRWEASLVCLHMGMLIATERSAASAAGKPYNAEEVPKWAIN